MSYDAKQRNAVLRQCLGCQQWFYFTNHQALTCGPCMWKAMKS